MRKILTHILILLTLLNAVAWGSVDDKHVKVTASGINKTLYQSILDGNLAGVQTPKQETPSGTINGVTTIFSLSVTPYASATVSLYLDGLLLTQGAGQDYTISGATITMAVAPVAGQSLIATYYKY